MQRSWRQTLAIVAAVALPLVAFAAFQLFAFAETQEQDLARQSDARAQEVADLVEASVLSELKLATVLATGEAIRNDDIAAAYRRAAELRAVSGAWATVQLSDPDRQLELFDLRYPYGDARSISPEALEAARLQAPAVEGIEADRNGGYAMPIHVPIRRNGRTKYLLTVALDPAAIQRVVGPRLAGASVAAVVDREGRFIYRSLDLKSRLGRPASVYVRRAVAKGGRGMYQGVTLEGLSNYTAYATGAVTGWSTHVAIQSSEFEQPRLLSRVGIVVAALGCLLLAALLVAFVLRDMRLTREAEARRVQAQKMEVLGQLTGGIAHDFNNLLTAIIGSLDLVLRRSSQDLAHRRYIEGALDAALRGAKLTSRLLAFSRVQRLALEPVDIAAILEGMAEILEHTLGPNVTVKRDVDPAARWVLTDPNQLELALLNLAINARDAMPEGGVVSFSTTMGADRDSRGHVDVRVRDTGQGMSPQTAARAFEPFFTTKIAGRGTGLGLAQVQELARQSGGGARVESAPGNGTTVILSLPAAGRDARASTAAIRPGPEPVAPKTGQRILVLDDDVDVRRVLVETLRSRGYLVFEAASGEDALSALPKIDPDLFMIDYLMPGLNGAEVAAMARRARPTQRILIVSGHFDGAMLDAAGPDMPVLRKPFDGPALAAAVAAALARPEPGAAT